MLGVVPGVAGTDHSEVDICPPQHDGAGHLGILTNSVRSHRHGLFCNKPGKVAGTGRACLLPKLWRINTAQLHCVNNTIGIYYLHRITIFNRQNFAGDVSEGGRRRQKKY